ncbi:MAG: MurT ligase domain-containing protein [Actinomycetota bacterium]
MGEPKRRLGFGLGALVGAGRAAGALSRVLGRGAGSTIPGKLVVAVAPGALASLASRIPGGVLLVSGTNGKTTTTRMIVAAAGRAGLAPATNPAGANLLSGLATGLLAGPGWKADLGLLEVDEAVLPLAVPRLRPKALVLTNLFRDQLDRYGELDTLGEKWREALAAAERIPALAVNADDPLLATVGQAFPGTLNFGLRDARHDLGRLPHASDSQYCRTCRAHLDYRRVYLGHLGEYACTACGWRPPALDLWGEEVELMGARAVALTVRTEEESVRVEVDAPGLYSAYNVLAAAAGCRLLGIPLAALAGGLADMRSAFGRGGSMSVRGRHVFPLLAKNPTGFDEVMRTVLQEEQRLFLLICLNDRIADGRDVSWIWDVDFERLAGRCAGIVASGTRALDLAVRLKYAGLQADIVEVGSDIPAMLERAIDLVPDGGTLFAVVTYTALHEVRGALRAGHERSAALGPRA